MRQFMIEAMHHFAAFLMQARLDPQDYEIHIVAKDRHGAYSAECALRLDMNARDLSPIHNRMPERRYRIHDMTVQIVERDEGSLQARRLAPSRTGFNSNELTLALAKALDQVPAADALPGGETQRLAKIQVMLNEHLETALFDTVVRT